MEKLDDQDFFYVYRKGGCLEMSSFWPIDGYDGLKLKKEEVPRLAARLLAFAGEEPK